MLEIREYLDARGRSPFTAWLRTINVQAAAKVATALERISDGNLSNVKSVSRGVHEYKIRFGPGYRLYFGRDGEKLVVLLAGGTKKRQQSDILRAAALWKDYRERKTKDQIPCL